MDIDILNKFCGRERDYGRHYHPFSDDKYSYGCDGSILIAVPRIDSIAEDPEMIAKIEYVKSDLLSMTAKTWIPLRKIVNTLVFAECSKCKGQGHTFECLECDGAGEIEWETFFNDYSNTCLSCGGVGTVSRDEWTKMAKQKDIKQDIPGHICDDCDGTGKIYQDTPVLIGGTVLSLRYLSMLGELPECRIGIIDDTKAVLFQFNGGNGLVMPMRGDSSTSVAYDDLEF